MERFNWYTNMTTPPNQNNISLTLNTNTECEIYIHFKPENDESQRYT